jgi:hypothetical protein
MSRNASQTFSPMSDLQAHTDVIHHRRDAPAKPKATPVKSLFTTDPLPQSREKRQTPLPKRRKPAVPTKPAFSFNPKDSTIPSGRQDLPLSLPIYPRPPASEYPTNSLDEPHAAPFSNHEPRDPSYDARKRPRIFAECSSIGQPIPSYPVSPSTDVNDTSSAESYDSSHTSSSSPDLSDQSHTYLPELPFPMRDYRDQEQAHPQMYSYNNATYVEPTIVHRESYGHEMDRCEDRPGQGYPIPYADVASASARLAPQSILVYSDNDSLPYLLRKY